MQLDNLQRTMVQRGRKADLGGGKRPKMGRSRDSPVSEIPTLCKERKGWGTRLVTRTGNGSVEGCGKESGSIQGIENPRPSEAWTGHPQGSGSLLDRATRAPFFEGGASAAITSVNTT